MRYEELGHIRQNELTLKDKGRLTQYIHTGG